MEKNTSRELTVEEVREMFLKNIWGIIKYWQNVDIENDTMDKRIEGAVFSVLAILDGSNINLPEFIVAPAPHEEDKNYCIENGQNYFPLNNLEDIKGNISGSLHELFDSYKK